VYIVKAILERKRTIHKVGVEIYSVYIFYYINLIEAKGVFMTKTKKATDIAKATSAFQKKLNEMKKKLHVYVRAVQNRKRRNRIDSQIIGKLKEKNPELFWEIINEVGMEKKKPKKV